MKRLISVLVLAFSFAAFAQAGSTPPAGDKPAAEKGEKKQKAKKSGKKSEKKSDETKPETAK